MRFGICEVWIFLSFEKYFFESINFRTGDLEFCDLLEI